MKTLFDPFLYLNFFYFLFAIFLAFYIPGDFFVKNLKLSFLKHTVSAVILGMVLFAWQGFIFGHLQVELASYLYLLFFLFLWLSHKRFKYLKLKFFSFDAFAFFIIIVGVLVQLLPVLGFGFFFEKGMYLCCGNREDFIYHLSLTSSLIQSIPPKEPGMYNVFVANYHYWSNLVSAELVKVFYLPIFYTQFQYLSVFLTLFLGLGVYSFAQSLQISKSYIRWLLFFIYFGADAIYALFLALGRNVALFKMVSSIEDGTTFLVNPPRAFSIVIAFIALLLLQVWAQKKQKLALLLSVFLFASSIGFKVYTGLFAVCGFIALSAFLLWKKRIQELLCIAFFLPVSAAIYFSTNASSGGLFFAPFVIARDFINQPSLGLIRLELARQIYLRDNKHFIVFLYELLYSFLFVVSIFGTKLLAFCQSIYSMRRIKIELHVFLPSAIMICFFTGMLFLQQSGGANIFNFIVSSWIFLSIYSALGAEYIQSKLPKIFRYGFIVLVVLFTIPRILLSSYLTITDYFKLDYLFIPYSQLQAFSFMKEHVPTDSVVIVDSDLGFDRGTPFVYAFTQKQMFLSGNNILESHQINTKKHNETIFLTFKSTNPSIVASQLYKNHINYILLSNKKNLDATESALFLKQEFKNDSLSLFKVNKKELDAFLIKQKQKK